MRPIRAADKPRAFVEALRFKYASDSDAAPLNIAYQVGKPPVQPGEKPIKISGKQVEEVGFDKIRAQQADLAELRIVLLDCLCVRRPIQPSRRGKWYGCDATDIREVCPKITELDLSRNLLEDWHEVAEICAQLDGLRSLKVEYVHQRSLNRDSCRTRSIG